MRKCLECGVDIPRRKFCSRKCSAIYRCRNTCLIAKDVLIKEYQVDKLELAEIGQKHCLSVGTVCKYLRKHGIPKRGSFIDFTGQKIGHLQVIAPIDLRPHKGGGKHVKWRCMCDCGNEYITYSHHLSSCITTRCQECVYKSRRSQLELKNYIWTNIKRSAESRNLEFCIERDWAYNLFLEQNRKCALSGVEISFPACAAEYYQRKTTASLDRIDSSGGYTKDNVRWVHKVVNIMRSTMSDEEFVEWCRRIVEKKDAQPDLI